MKKLIKSEVYRSHKQYTGPLLKCALYTEEMSTTAAKKKKKRGKRKTKRESKPGKENPGKDSPKKRKKKRVFSSLLLRLQESDKELCAQAVLFAFKKNSKR